MIQMRSEDLLKLRGKKRGCNMMFKRSPMKKFIPKRGRRRQISKRRPFTRLNNLLSKHNLKKVVIHPN